MYTDTFIYRSVYGTHQIPEGSRPVTPRIVVSFGRSVKVNIYTGKRSLGRVRYVLVHSRSRELEEHYGLLPSYRKRLMTLHLDTTKFYETRDWCS